MLLFCWSSVGFIFHLKCINWFCNNFIKLSIKYVPLNFIATFLKLNKRTNKAWSRCNLQIINDGPISIPIHYRKTFYSVIFDYSVVVVVVGGGGGGFFNTCHSQ